MSKKLIAVASAAALALTALVAVPAQAATFTTDVNNVTAGNTTYATAATAFEITDAMESGTLDYVGETTGTVARFEITTGAAATVVVTVTGGVKLTDTLEDSAEEALKIGAGSATISKSTTTASPTFTFYAYTNSTTAGSVIVDSGSQRKTYFIKGKPGTPQNLVDVKFPTSVVASTLDNNTSPNLITYQVTDAFGNKLVAASLADVVLTATGVSVINGEDGSYNAATSKKRWENWVTGDVQSSVSMQLKLDADDLTGAGFPAAKDVAFSTVSAGTLADQVKSLTAQLATLQAAFVALEIIKDRKVSKLKYNRLARKWNAAFPSNKVWVKP